MAAPSDLEVPSLVVSDESENELIGFDSSDLEELSGSDPDLLPEIDPHYSSDDTDFEEENTIGNIPINAYEKYPHIGYNIDGKRIMRPATQSAIDQLLETIDLPEGYTGLIDRNTGQNLNLSKEDMDLIERVQRGLLPNDEINPFEDQLEWFSNNPEKTPLESTNEPKRRFVPSKHEAKRVMKMVRAIKEGKLVIKDYDLERKEYLEQIDDDQMMVLNKKLYDVWESEEQIPLNRMHLSAPKMPPPTNDESYNPPSEYLLTEEEKEKFLNTDPEDREVNFIPQKFTALRRVPGYANTLRERFERCLDLYLAPRMRNKRVNVDPNSLIPELPSPQELKPFPIVCSTVYEHKSLVRTLSVDFTGNYLATGDADGNVRVFDVLSGRELYRLEILKMDTYQKDEDAYGVHSDDQIDFVKWHPKLLMLSVAAGDNVYLVVPNLNQDISLENQAFESLDKGWAYKADGNMPEVSHEGMDSDAEVVEKKKSVEWEKPPQKLAAAGCRIVLRSTKRFRKIDWHFKGDYFVTVQPDAGSSSVLVHQLSKHATQCPFKRAKGLVQDAKFHPFRPHLYVASQRYVRIYNLATQTLLKRLLPGVKWLSTFDVHPTNGDNVVMSSFDQRVAYVDMELSNRPFKTLRYHQRAVRDVKFHPKLPLFCSASDDGTINVLHCTVYDDPMKNPLLVPLKILSGHKVVGSLGVLQVAWHPREAWLFSCGGDGTVRLWTT